MQKSVAVIGCGWLGLPLAERLVSKGYTVFGTTTSPEKIALLNEKGIQSSIFRLQTNLVSSEDDLRNGPDFTFLSNQIPHADVYVVNLPPSGVTNYPEAISLLAKSIPGSAKQIIFCSTTSVYPDIPSTVNESLVSPDDHVTAGEADEARHGTKRSDLLQAERSFWSLGNATILRLAGLFGAGRHPVRFLSGRKKIASPDARVNLVHLVDVVDIIESIIARNIRHEVINVCASEHPTRKDYYTTMADKLDLPAPLFDESDKSTGKLINNDKLIQMTMIVPSLYAYD